MNRARRLLLRYGLILPVALALYHLIPAKLRKSINGSLWMQAPLPPKLLAQVGRTKSRHSLKTRITVLVVIAIVLSAGIITLINASNIRKSEVRTTDLKSDLVIPQPESSGLYRIEAIRRKDHALVRITDAERVQEVILALPDNMRFMYLAVTGEHCEIYNLLVQTDEAACEEAIPRIAEEISFIKGCPEGDVPNIEVDGWRTDTTEGIPVTGAMRLSFHAMSLPTARMVWHCPFISVFSSENGRVNGPGFREYMLLRLDGENWESDEHVNNSVQVEQKASFRNWNAWKDGCKQGIDCVVTIGRDGSRVTMQTENMGVAVSSVTTILDDTADVFVALTGDRVAITNVRVLREELE